jgi:hypothetical protein
MTAALRLILALLVGGIVLGAEAAISAPALPAAEKRVALVIGNGAYRDVAELPNPPNDAREVAGSLKRLGFTVIEGYDVAKAEMDQRLRDFGRAADNADTAVVYYAGHGLQVADKNYLVPVDAKLEHGEQDVRWELVPLDAVLEETQTAKRLQVIILDACRTNPFAAKMARSLGSRAVGKDRGLAAVSEDGGTNIIVSYATAAGKVAKDGGDQHSPYTKALLRNIDTPGLEIRRLFGKVRDQVMGETGGDQQPYVYESLGGDEFFFNPPTTTTVAVTSPPAAASSFDPRQIELEFWNEIKNSNNPVNFREYLNRYPDGTFATLARSKLDEQPTTAGSTAPPAAPNGPACPKEARLPAMAPSSAQNLPAKAVDAFKKGEEAFQRGDYMKAFRSLSQAADLGHPLAQNQLGMMYQMGSGAPPDGAEALKWFRKAADQGLKTAAKNIGYLYEHGSIGVQKDVAQARYWYCSAAAAGQADAKQALERLDQVAHTE